MSNDYFNATGIPGQASFGSSAAIRALMSSVASGFDKLPILTGNALKLVRVNASATGLEALASMDSTPIGAGGASTGAFTALSATSIATLDAGAQCRSSTSLPLGGAEGALMVGYLNGNVTSTTDAYVAWGGVAATTLNPSGVNGSMILAARNTAGASLYLATRNAVRVDVSDNGNVTIKRTTSGTTALAVLGNVLEIGTATASIGQGGNIRHRNDTGALAWAAGILGSSAETAWSLFDIVGGAERFRMLPNGNATFGAALGINGKSPAVNVTAPVAASDLATVITLANDMRVRLGNFGLYT